MRLEFRFGAQTPSWRGHGAVMARSWRRHGAVMAPSWRRHGAVMAPSWRLILLWNLPPPRFVHMSPKEEKWQIRLKMLCAVS